MCPFHEHVNCEDCFLTRVAVIAIQGAIALFHAWEMQALPVSLKVGKREIICPDYEASDGWFEFDLLPPSKRCLRACFSRRRRLRRDRQHIRQTGQRPGFFRQSCALQALHIERAGRRREDVLLHMGLPTHVLRHITSKLKAGAAHPQ